MFVGIAFFRGENRLQISDKKKDLANCIMLQIPWKIGIALK